MSTGSFIKVMNDTINHALFEGNADYLGAWVWMLCRAAYADHDQFHGSRKYRVHRGELVASRAYMAKAWGWSDKRVRIFLDILASEGMIKRGQVEGRTGARISICKYETFQHNPKSLGSIKGQDRAKTGPEETDDTDDTDKISTSYEVLVDQPPADGLPTPSEIENDLLGEQVTGGRSKPQPIVEAFNAYNAMAEKCDLPQAAKMTPGRRKSIGARLREHGIDGWHVMLGNIERSAFLRGQTKDWRVPGLDWLIKPANFNKVIEGAYGNGAHATGTGTTVSEERAAQLLREHGLEM